MDDFLSKPIHQDRLWAAITACVGTAKADAGYLLGKAEVALYSDTETALERVGGDRTFFAEQIALFLLDCPRLMKSIGVAIAHGDAPRVRADTHTLKNWVSNFIAPSVLEATLAMETIGRGGDMSVPQQPTLPWSGRSTGSGPNWLDSSCRMQVEWEGVKVTTEELNLEPVPPSRLVPRIPESSRRSRGNAPFHSLDIPFENATYRLWASAAI